MPIPHPRLDEAVVLCAVPHHDDAVRCEDIVDHLLAALALLSALAAGVVPLEDAFSGFSDDIVIIVGSALLVSAGVARSGIMEYALRRFVPDLKSVRAQLALLVVTVALLSAFVKNIGALAIMIPIAFQFARRSSASPSIFLMPMAFASLLGGLMTQIGTSPNIVVSRVRGGITGTAFTMFDFAPSRSYPYRHGLRIPDPVLLDPAAAYAARRGTA